MPKKMYILLVSIIIPLLQVSAQDTEKVRSIKVTDKITVFKPGINSITANMNYIESKDGLIVIDTHITPTISSRIKSFAEKHLNRTDYKFVINTHHHFDHSGGNKLFTETPIIAQENAVPASLEFNKGISDFLEWRIGWGDTKRKQMEDGRFSDEEAAGWRDYLEFEKIFIADLNSGHVTTPANITFAEEMIIRLSDMTVELRYIGPSHTDNHILIYIPEERALFIGDSFWPGRIFMPITYNKNADLGKHIEAMDKAFGNEHGVEHVICGHTIGEAKYFLELLQYMKILNSECSSSEGDTADAVAERISKKSEHLTLLNLTAESTQDDNLANVKALLAKSQ